MSSPWKLNSEASCGSRGFILSSPQCFFPSLKWYRGQALIPLDCFMSRKVGSGGTHKLPYAVMISMRRLWGFRTEFLQVTCICYSSVDHSSHQGLDTTSSLVLASGLSLSIICTRPFLFYKPCIFFTYVSNLFVVMSVSVTASTVYKRMNPLLCTVLIS